uniref:Uncharacterized protein n=1 Tax=Cacopsylla melanoneura TaxID=428564 RepID=A0A8D9EX35_9HEMI
MLNVHHLSFVHFLRIEVLFVNLSFQNINSNTSIQDAVIVRPIKRRHIEVKQFPIPRVQLKQKGLGVVIGERPVVEQEVTNCLEQEEQLPVYLHDQGLLVQILFCQREEQSWKKVQEIGQEVETECVFNGYQMG